MGVKAQPTGLDECGFAGRARVVWRHRIAGFARGSKRFSVLVVLTGAAAGVGAALLEKLLNAVQALAWPGGGEGSSSLAAFEAASPARRVFVLLLAGALVSVFSLATRMPTGGHGTARILEAIWLRASRLRLGRALARGVLSIVGVGLGVSLGREGALIQTGAATGAWMGERLGLPDSRVRLLVACGASAGIAAAYNVPIGAAVFGLEVLLGSFALELFGPVVMSCIIATLIARALHGEDPSYLIPHYQLARPSDLLSIFALGPLLGVGSALFVKVVDLVPRLVERIPARARPLLPMAATLSVGLMAVGFPQVLGNGYDTVNAALLGRLPIGLLVALPLLRLLATALCAGFGVPGGLFTPSLFFGALLGGAGGWLLEHLFPGAVPSGAWALLGMGGVLAGTTHAAVSSVLIIFELTGDYGLMLPLMACCVLAAQVGRRIEPHSLYTAVLSRRKLAIPEPHRPEWLQPSTPVRALVSPCPESVPPFEPFGSVVMRLLSQPGSDLYVTDPDGKLEGVVVLDQLKGHIPDESLLGMVVAADVMDRTTPLLRPEMTLGEAAERFAQTELARLPVVDGSGRLLGVVLKGDVLRRGRF